MLINIAFPFAKNDFLQPQLFILLTLNITEFPMKTETLRVHNLNNCKKIFIHILHFPVIVEPSFNAMVGVHNFGPHCKQGVLGIPISATRGLLNKAISVSGTKNAVKATATGRTVYTRLI